MPPQFCSLMAVYGYTLPIRRTLPSIFLLPACSNWSDDTSRSRHSQPSLLGAKQTWEFVRFDGPADLPALKEQCSRHPKLMKCLW